MPRRGRPVKDIVGQRFGKLLVLEQFKGSRIRCQCDCGKSAVLDKRNVIRGTTSSCGCLLTFEGRTEIVGKRYGKLTVIRRGSTQNRIECQCDCGDGLSVDMWRVVSGKITCCKKCRPVCAYLVANRETASIRRLFNHYKHNAKVRDVEWELTLDEFASTCALHCHYCGLEPSNCFRSGRFATEIRYSGVDRLDNGKGYVTGNIVPACKECNWAKGKKSVTSFSEWLDRIAAFRKP